MKSTYPIIAGKTPGRHKNNKGNTVNSERSSSRTDDIIHLIAENSSDLFLHFRLKPVPRLAYVSASSMRIIGYLPEELYADADLPRKIVHPEDKDLFENFIHSDTDHDHRPIALRWIHKNGNIIWTEQTKATIRNERGEPVDSYFICRDVTEHKLSETALLESQKFATNLLEHAPHATVVIKPDTSVEYVNPAWERQNGWTLAEVVGIKAPYPWWPEPFKDAFFEGFKKAMQEGSGKSEIIAQKKNGELYWIEMNWAPVTHNGELLYLLINSVDITERKQAEKAVHDSEEKFSKAFHASPVIVAITTVKDGKYIDVNDSYTQYTGYSREELIGKTTTDMHIWVNADDRARVFKILQEQGRVHNIECDFRMKSGEIRTWILSLEPITIGEEPCLIGVSLDITERKQIEKDLRESEEKYRELISTSFDGIVSIDSRMKITIWNQGAERIFGYTQKEMLGESIFKIVPEVSHEAMMKKCKMPEESGSHPSMNLTFETTGSRKDQTIIPIDLSITARRVGGNTIATAIIRDISERNQMEKDLRESEEKFSKAFYTSPDMMSIVNLRNRQYVEVNDSYLHFLGFSRDELIGHSIDEFNLWVDKNDSDNIKSLMLKQGKVRHQELQLRTKSGEIRTWLCSLDTINLGGELCMLTVATDVTERKKIEQALRESEEKFSAAFHSSPNMIIITDIENNCYLELNDAFTKTIGYTREELMNCKLDDIPMWANPEELQEMTRLLKTQGKAHNKEYSFRKKSGEILKWLCSAEVVTIGGRRCTLAVATDITQQKQAEEQLRLLGSVTRQVSDAIAIADPSLNITFINQAAQDLFGYTLEEVVGKSLFLLNDKPPSKNTLQEILKTTANGKTWKGLVIKKRKNGGTFICDCRISPLYDEKSKLCSYICVQRDVTAQQEMETKLQEHKKLVESILATMPEGVLVLDNRDRIILANEAFYRILHLHKRKVNSKLLNEILPVDQFFHLHKAVKHGGTENNSLEFRYQAQDIDKILYCVIVKMGKERTLLTFTDISQEREKEDKLYLTDRLASIGEMAAGLAHELNNPLTGILALSQLLLDGNMSQEHKEDLECIHSEAQRAAGIVKNVLLFARHKNGDTGRASVNEVIKDVLRLREYEQRVNNIKVVTELQEPLPDIPVDQGQLQQVFLNMISNAEAAIKEVNRPGILTVTTQRVNNHINILFSDNGCGIKKQILPRIFDPFFTTKEIGKGTGLGLSICYSIIVKHGGKISVKSQVNEGTTFTIRMPIITPSGKEKIER